MAEPYLRVVVTHEPLKGEAVGQEAVYHVRRLLINEPFRLHSDTGGVVTLLPLGEEAETEEVRPESRGV